MFRVYMAMQPAAQWPTSSTAQAGGHGTCAGTVRGTMPCLACHLGTVKINCCVVMTCIYMLLIVILEKMN